MPEEYMSRFHVPSVSNTLGFPALYQDGLESGHTLNLIHWDAVRFKEKVHLRPCVSSQSMYPPQEQAFVWWSLLYPQQAK